MKTHIIGMILLITVNSYAQSNNETQKTLNAVVSHAEEASLYRNKVNWDTVKSNIYKLAKDAQTIDQLTPAFKYLLKSLGDEHGRIFNNNNIIAYYNSTEPKEHLRDFDSDINYKIQMGQTYSFHAEMLEDKIGYIRIVGLPMGDNQKMASDIQSKVCYLINKGAENWVIDLRYNGGGNINPMAEGIALIFGNEVLGGSKGLTEYESSTWKIENNHFYYDSYSIELEDSCEPIISPHIAVLTSLYTASSGEAVAVMFKGKENTKFFGQNTAGMITVTDWEIINESTTMAISVSNYKDRNGKVYLNYVDVDEEHLFVSEPLSEDDTAVHSAINWINDK